MSCRNTSFWISKSCWRVVIPTQYDTSRIMIQPCRYRPIMFYAIYSACAESPWIHTPFQGEFHCNNDHSSSPVAAAQPQGLPELGEVGTRAPGCPSELGNHLKTSPQTLSATRNGKTFLRVFRWTPHPMNPQRGEGVFRAGGWRAAGGRCLGPAPALSPAQRCGGGQRGNCSAAVEESDGLGLRGSHLRDVGIFLEL